MDELRPPRSARFELGEWEIDPRANCLRQPGECCQLEPKTMAVLLTLIDASGGILTKTELLDEVWPSRYVVEGVLKRAVSQLRKALGDDARQPRYVQTVFKVGYRLLQPARRLPCTGTDRIVTGTRQDILGVLHGLDGAAQGSTRLTLLIDQTSSDVR